MAVSPLEQDYQEYFQAIIGLLGRVRDSQRAALLEAAGMIADQIAQGGILYLSGCGHAQMIAEELVGRAGGLFPADRIPGGQERLEGAASQIFGKYRIPAGSVLIIISNSGRNPFGVELALEAKRKGLKVIAVTNLAHSRSVESRHSSGQRLFEVADLVLDNCGTVGDAHFPVAGYPFKAGATSSLAGVAMLKALEVLVARELARRGQSPPVYMSANIDGGDEHNRRLEERYRRQKMEQRGER